VHVLGDRRPDQLVGAIAQQPLAGIADEDDLIVLVDDEDGIQHQLDESGIEHLHIDGHGSSHHVESLELP